MYAILQRSKEVSADTATYQKPQQTTANHTGLPDQLKRGIEGLSGYSMDRVRVHYHSSNPAQLQALAYTQGTDIHVASGQERNLPHEAWHVVQQMQGRVRPTMRINGIPVNEDSALEHEADVMGEKAVQCAFRQSTIRKPTAVKGCLQAKLPPGVNWGDLYRNIRDDELIDTNRRIRNSKNLVRSLDRSFWKTGYFKFTLEKESGLRRLANDIKLVRKYVKIAQGRAAQGGAVQGGAAQGGAAQGRATRRYARFARGDIGVLKTAQHLINNEIEEIEGQKYGSSRRGSNYMKEENDGHFARMKGLANTMITNTVLKGDGYLEYYFNHSKGSLPDPDFYNRIKNNYSKIQSKLPIIGYKNNYSSKSGVFAYVYKGDRQQPANTYIDGKEVGETYISSRLQGGRETGMQIRLSSAYRRAGEGGKDSKPGVIIHEASHLILGTGDLAYGTGIYALPPAQAEINADTYEYAAENALGI